MKKTTTSRLGKQCIDLIKQELLAIISVGIVLALLFSRSLAAGLPEEAQPTTSTDKLQTAEVTQTVTDISQPAGESLFYGQPTIYFGSDIKGINRSDFETWQKETGNKNYGGYLQILESNEVKIRGAANGTHKVWVKALGKLTINGVGFTFKTIRTLVKIINVTDGTITIKFTAGAQIYTMSTLQLEKETTEEESPAVPISIAILPYHSTVMLNKYTPATFRPLVIILDQDNKQIPITDGLLQWSSSDSKMAIVDNNGLVTPKSPGAVTVSVQVGGTSLIASTSVLVRAAEEAPLIDITPQAQNAIPKVANSTTAVEPATTANNISNFFANLLNLKPSSAAKTPMAPKSATIVISSPTSPTNYSITSANTADNLVALTSFLQKIASTLKKGVAATSTLFQQTLGNWLSFPQ